MKTLNLIAILGGFASLILPYTHPEIGNWMSIGWGLLFLSWIADGFRTDEMLFLINAHREENPLAFWLTALLWFCFSIMFILKPFFPAYF
ncbi:hypothetical protein [Sediminicola luteus]|uniref:Uncharacterized protein n=1 Tax=Sediminicola luteus TaxID=319238 RepID=A0A2A4GDH6_9FLAO|nr:hypothetical protein [Sediminicola luteus]PCE66034.1 hypothetical protein B7P33_01660 [Sediminicola luteus]